MPNPRIITRRTAHSGYLKVDCVGLEYADGSRVEHEVASYGSAVGVLPYDAVRRTALTVELFRLPVLEASGATALHEACAGMIEEGEDPEAAIRREAGEELGVRLSVLEPVATLWPSPGVSTETLTLYLAPYGPGDLTGKGGGAPGEHEDITVREAGLAALARAADRGEIQDVKLFTLLGALRLRRPELFTGGAVPSSNRS